MAVQNINKDTLRSQKDVSTTASAETTEKDLIKKLEENNTEDLSPDFINPNSNTQESAVVILCNGKELSQSLQLKLAKELYWPFDDLLTLTYTRRDVDGWY